MKPTFDQTVSKLIQWYLRGTLKHGICHACVVGNLINDWMFNGLMAVVDVLADIHGINLEAKEEAKKLFIKV